MHERSSGRRRGAGFVATLTAGLILAAGPAVARETVVDIAAHEAAGTAKAQAFLLGVPFWLKGESRGLRGEPLQVSEVTRAASGVMRSDQAACTSAFLDALKVLQQKCIQLCIDLP